MPKTVLVTMGTRPEAVKLAPVIRALKGAPDDFSTVVCTTGQHTTMLSDVLGDLKITADISLNMPKNGASLTQLNVSLLAGMDTILGEVSPDVSIVHGDTTTALSAAVASFYSGTQVAHVEAGLRTNNLFSPFPEEFNRKAISIVASLNFAPTARAQSSLLAEGVSADSISVTGNTVIDSLMWTTETLRQYPEIGDRIVRALGIPEGFSPIQHEFVLVTFHRRENQGEGIESICEAILRLSRDFPHLSFIFPVHLNPRVRGPVTRILSGVKNVILLRPLGYFELVFLLTHTLFVMTDSGGLQEEAPSLGKPVLVLREVTERPEAVNCGSARLVGTSTSTLVASASELISNVELYERMSHVVNPYGDGFASDRILARLREEFS